MTKTEGMVKKHITHWICILRCCDECKYINLPDQETNKNMNKQNPQLGFTFITLLDVVLPMVEFY